MTDQTIDVGSTKTYSLPSITDPDGDAYTISVSMGSATSFTTYSNGKLTFAPKATASSSTTSVTVTLKDTNTSPMSLSYTFNIIIKGVSTASTNSSSSTSSDLISTDSDSSGNFTSLTTASNSTDPNRNRVKNWVKIEASTSFLARI